MFEELPFGRGGMAIMCGGAVVGGTLLVLSSVRHQNKKHGFSK